MSGEVEQLDRAREFRDDESDEDAPEIPRVTEPRLDRKGEISQRTVEQKKKQEELVKATARIKGTNELISIIDTQAYLSR